MVSFVSIILALLLGCNFLDVVTGQPNEGSIVDLDAKTFKQYLDDPSTKWFDVIVDVRSLSEWNSGHIPGATLVENLAASFGGGANGGRK